MTKTNIRILTLLSTSENMSSATIAEKIKEVHKKTTSETINNSIKYLSAEGYIDKVFITRDNPNFYYSLSITPRGRQYLEDSILNSKRYLYNTWITVITLIATIVSIIISLLK